MSEREPCPTCGAALPPDAPGGACPKCLLAAGFESGDGTAGGTSGESGADGDGPDVAAVARQFPELEIMGVLGRGGMGVVYKARQKQLDRLVALKVLPRAIAAAAPDAARFEDRFTREARALARLAHPNIVAVHEFGEREGMYYFLMEYVDGVNLRGAMREGRLSPAAALAIVPQICDALQFAHDQGVVHRDIKPENVLLDREGHVKIADFGLAKLVTPAAGDRTLTRQGLVMGTPHYMAPEQIEKPAEVDHRADIYSLGVVLYEMLTGELPIGRFAAPSQKVHVDVRLDDVVLRSLEKEPARRYQAVSELKTGIGAVDATVGDGAPTPPRDHPARPGGRTSKLAFWGLLLPLIAVAGGTILSVVGVLLARGGGMNPSLSLRWLAPVSLLAAMAVLVGLVLSIAGIVQIRRSGGRLRGMGLAVTGLLLPLFCCLPGVGLAWMGTFRSATPATREAVAELPPIPELGTYDDLGIVRVRVELPATTVLPAPLRVRIDGSAGGPGAASLSTEADARWPPEPDTVLQILRFEVRRATGDGTARLLRGDELLAGVDYDTPGRAPVTAELGKVLVPAAEAGDLAIEFAGSGAQDVTVILRVLRPVR